MEIVRSVAAMQAWSAERRRAGETIGFVPTMGYLHHGHASLMALARPRCDRLVASVYVNPLQFGPTEDLSRYPRDPDGDARACAGQGVDVLFLPESLYPPGFATTVSVGRVTQRWEGASRPGHFDGVATVVARLFGIVRADLAVFGEKDWQQLVVVRHLVADLALPVQLVPGPIVRDADGLAASSRNQYLTTEARTRATSIARAVGAAQRAVASGVLDATAIEAAGRAVLAVDAVDYFAVVDALSLEPLPWVDRPARLLTTCRVGGVRLLDNVALGPELSWT